MIGIRRSDGASEVIGHLCQRGQRLLLILTALTCVRCAPNSPASPPKSATTKGPSNSEHEFEKLHKTYLTESMSVAETSLHDIIKMASSEPFSDASMQMLYISHSRLHIIAKLKKESDSARCEYVKAQFWDLLKKEKSGNFTKQELARSLAEFTERECDRYIIEWDKGISSNVGYSRPKYWDDLIGKTVTCDQWIESTYGN